MLSTSLATEFFLEFCNVGSSHTFAQRTSQLPIPWMDFPFQSPSDWREALNTTQLLRLVATCSSALFEAIQRGIRNHKNA